MELAPVRTAQPSVTGVKFDPKLNLPNSGEANPKDTLQSMQGKNSSSCCLVLCWNKICAFFSAIARCICSLFGRSSQKPSSSKPSTTPPETLAQIKTKSPQELSLLLPLLKPALWTVDVLEKCEECFGLPSLKGESGYYKRFRPWGCYNIIADTHPCFAEYREGQSAQFNKLEFLHALTDVNRAGADALLAQSISTMGKETLEAFTAFLNHHSAMPYDKEALKAALGSDDPVTAVHQFADRLILADRRDPSSITGIKIKWKRPLANKPYVEAWISQRLSNYAAQFAGQNVKYDRASLMDATYGCITDFQGYSPREQLEFVYVLTQSERAGEDQAHKYSILTMPKEALGLFIDALQVGEPIAFNKKLLQDAFEQDNPVIAIHQFVSELLLAYTRTAAVPTHMLPLP